MSPNPTVAALQAAFQTIDQQTSRAGAAATAIGTRIQALLDKIANAATDEELQPLLTEAQTEVSNLTQLGDALEAMGKDPANPVPVPVPEPTPAPAPTGDGTGTTGDGTTGSGDAGTGAGATEAPPEGSSGTTVE